MAECKVYVIYQCVF